MTQTPGDGPHQPVGHDHHAQGHDGQGHDLDDPAPPDLASEILREEFWDARYAGDGQAWSGQPNPQLVAEVAGTRPGRALDVGCGEGADVVWLARQGWEVTGADISTAAIRRATAAVEAAGVADRVRWQHLDVVQAAPEPAAYDLVSAHFLHLPPGPRAAAVAGLAAAVAPGGTLLLVAHHPLDRETVGHGDRPAELMPDEHEVAAELDPEAWDLQVVQARPRTRVADDGSEVQHHDLVVRAVRRG